MTDLDLVCEYLRWRPMYHRLVLIHAVNHDSAAPPHIVDAILRKLLHARRLHDDVEPIRVVLPELIPLRLRVLPVELDVLVARIKLPRDIHLDAFICGDHDAVRTVQFE